MNNGELENSTTFHLKVPRKECPAKLGVTQARRWRDLEGSMGPGPPLFSGRDWPSHF